MHYAHWIHAHAVSADYLIYVSTDTSTIGWYSGMVHPIDFNKRLSDREDGISERCAQTGISRFPQKHVLRYVHTGASHVLAYTLSPRHSSAPIWWTHRHGQDHQLQAFSVLLWASFFWSSSHHCCASSAQFHNHFHTPEALCNTPIGSYNILEATKLAGSGY